VSNFKPLQNEWVASVEEDEVQEDGLQTESDSDVKIVSKIDRKKRNLAKTLARPKTVDRQGRSGFPVDDILDAAIHEN